MGLNRTYSDSIGEKSGECTSDTSGAEEEGLAELSLVARVPQSDIVGHTGVQTSLCRRLLV
jgi:hypothetical protein